MPELPEVETVRNTLKLNILNKKIKDVKVYYSNIIQNVSKEEFINKLKGQTFIDVLRKGKHLIFVLDDYYLIGHMRMEGKYFLMHDEEINKHDHIIFEFNDSNLRYNDTRKFGTMHLYSKSDDIYNEIVNELRKIIDDMKKLISYINISMSLISLVILIVIEVYQNRFRKEYYKFLKMLNVNL